MNQSAQQPAGWILYDDSCGICRRWVPFWEKTLQRRGFAIAPLQADWVREKLQLSEPELMQDLRLLLASGELISGADTYRYAMKRIWWALPLYWFSIAPVGRNLFDFAYRKFADNRLKASAVCGLSNRPGK
jgi:predicted DCC family thiol-disulfide oxidoreductase YuxK